MKLRARHRRLGFVVLLLSGVSAATALALSAFNDNLFYFYPPTKVVSGEAPRDYPIRVGGLVAMDSIEQRGERLRTHFVVTDGEASVPVVYSGVLPDLFEEGSGVIVRGRVDQAGRMTASEVLAKHDENYMPPEVADSLKTGNAGMPPK